MTIMKRMRKGVLLFQMVGQQLQKTSSFTFDTSGQSSVDFSTYTEPLAFYKYFFNDALVRKIFKETNVYGAAKTKDWVDVDDRFDEIYWYLPPNGHCKTSKIARLLE